jgi:chorismate lyase/3-hydroxybenzoate synthase
MHRTSNRIIDAPPAAVPAWADELVAADQDREWEKRSRGVELRVRCGPCFTLIEAVVAGAAELGEGEFAAAVEAAYARIGDELGGLSASHPVRFWNYLPEIHRRGADGTDRYMVFNTARQAAYRRWSRDGPLGGNLPTASALDSGRPELIVHALAASCRGRSFENPRQVPAYRYSSRYGPEPPCFARATAIPAEEAGEAGTHRLMIGGTASIVGEESRHPGDLSAQLEETANNLASLLAAMRPEAQPSRPVPSHEAEPGPELSDLRAYVVRPSDHDAVVSDLTRRFPGVHRLEIMPAQLCRRALLVEIEGLAFCEMEPPDSRISVEQATHPPRDAAGDGTPPTAPGGGHNGPNGSRRG